MRRFWSKVDRRGLDECWPWKAATGKDGYGTFRFNGRYRTAHSVAWELENGEPMPKGMWALHTCDNRPCCNPAHVFPGTHQDNMADMAAKNRRKGIHAVRGEGHPNARLTDEKVRAIRQDTRSCRVLAAIYGVDPMTISCARSGKLWSHVR